MNEIEFLQQQIAVMQRRLSELKQTSKTYLLTKPADHFDWIIEFDGGTSCNDPAKGFGNGYGSFLLKERPNDPLPIERRQFGIGHSCNSAEIMTLVSALDYLATNIPIAKTSRVLCRGDSKIALKWVSCKKIPPEKSSPKFRESIATLRKIVGQFQCVRTEWRSRDESVRLFGH